MGEHLNIRNVTIEQLDLYYVFVILSFLYLVYRYRNETFAIYVILLFFGGLFSYLSFDIFNYYKIVILLLTIYWLIRTKSLQLKKGTKFTVVCFLIFSLTFFLTSFINRDYFLIIFSQYSRYVILFALFLIFMKYRNVDSYKNNLERIIFDLLIVQIFLSLAKFFIMGPVESLVGSIGSQGGAIATSLPILGFMFIWIIKRGVLKRKDLLFIVGLIFIGFMSEKRAIWFILPIIIAFFMFYIPKRKIPLRIILLSIIAVPIVFYFGVRLNYTLNKEGKMWGSFDMEYVYNYAETYSFGEDGNKEQGKGRGTATLLLFDKLVNGEVQIKEWFGYGLRFMYTTDYYEFAKLGFGIEHKGSATGVYQTMVSNGYLGIFATTLFALSILIQTRNKRLKYVIIGFFAWEYFFYTGIVFRDQSLAFILLYIVIFSDKILTKDKNGNVNKTANGKRKMLLTNFGQFSEHTI